MLIKRGDTHPSVNQVQRKLRAYGYIVQVTGTFNLETEVAVRLFQRRNSLSIDGIVGTKTWQLLKGIPEVLNEPRVYPIEVVHRTEYFSQRDNKNRPHGTCGPTSIAMVLNFHDARWNKSTQLEDQIYWWLNQNDAKRHFQRYFPWAVGKYNPWNIAGMLRWVVETKYGLIDDFAEYSWSDIKHHLKTHGPVVMSGRFTGVGHIITLLGLSIDGDLIVHDPYGDWNQGYHKEPNGAYRIYNKEDATTLMKPNGKKPWAHLIKRS